ncbi:hypothetical protein HaLaN_25949, partial [Haematococcus lacustris]
VLRIMWELSPFMRSFDGVYSVDFAQCAIALASQTLFKSLHPMYSNWQFSGQLTMSPLPASTEVLDRSTMQLVPCTAQLCNSQRASMQPQYHKGELLCGQQCLPKTRPMCRSASSVGCSEDGLLGLLTMQASMQNPYNPGAPIRTSGLLGWMPGEPLDQPGITSWKTNGYNYSDVASYAKALEATLTLPGTAMDFRVA